MIDHTQLFVKTLESVKIVINFHKIEKNTFEQ